MQFKMCELVSDWEIGLEQRSVVLTAVCSENKVILFRFSQFDLLGASFD